LFVVWIGSSGVAHAARTISLTPDSPPAVDFGSVRMSNSATTPTSTRTFRIDSTGDMSLTVSNITFSMTDYRLNPMPSFPLNIPAGMSANITVEFNPISTGTRTATMTIANNSMNDSPKDVSLTGVGTAAVISVPDTIDFGIVNNG